MNPLSIALYIVGGLIAVAFLMEVAAGHRRAQLRARHRRATR